MKKQKRSNKNRFYDNKSRDQKWTEQPTGRPIDFADKYIYGEADSVRRPTYADKVMQQERVQRRKRRILGFVLSIIFICAGYTCTDIYMTRQAVPAEQQIKDENSGSGNMSTLKLDLISTKVESISLDNSTMLDAVIKDAQMGGYNSVTFDAKRSDGTIGYASQLASIDTYGAIGNNSTHTKESVQKLLDNGILPIARISCYRDNVVPSQNDSMALKKGSGYYTDDKDNTYLNPNSTATYEYLKGIVQELYSYGITVFVLNNYNLPSDVSQQYNDGYKVIADKLNEDFDGKIKVIQEIRVTITGRSAENGKITNTAINKEIKKFKKINDDQIYYISSKLDNSRIMAQLNKNNVKNFIVG